ncbi:MAG: SPOR domain-containing protein [Bacteroidales bacterium]|nr:SPOR domain-containing protein [Bacteroidales bacterium]
MKYITILAALLLALPCWAQQQRRGHTQITGNTAVAQLVEKHVEFNERVKTVPGFRIQIGSFSGTNSKSSAFALKEKFLATYPEMTAYLVFDEPNFRVKVGDFTTRLDAFVFLQHIKVVYPGTIVKDNVYPIRIDWDELVPETDDDANE